MAHDTDYSARSETIANQVRTQTVRRLIEDDDTAGFGDLTSARSASSNWMHVPARGRLRIAVLSKRAYRYDGHWFDGSMHNCPPAGCPYCLRRVGLQTKLVIAVTDLDMGGQGLLELTPAAASVIARQCNEASYLRGLTFSLRHDGGRSNGRIIVEPTGPVLSLASLPDDVDIAEIMSAQWAQRGEL